MTDCNKMHFGSKQEAKAHITDTKRNARRRDKQIFALFPYKCYNCDGWHLTKQNKAVRKQKERKHKRKANN